MSISIYTDNQRWLGKFNAGSLEDMRQASLTNGGPILRDFLEEGGTDNVQGLLADIQAILQQPISQETKPAFSELFQDLSKAGSCVFMLE